MNIIFNKCIFDYLCIFYSSTKYFHEFQSIFVNFRFTDIFVKMSTDIYRYFRYIRKSKYHISVITDILFLGPNYISIHISNITMNFKASKAESVRPRVFGTFYTPRVVGKDETEWPGKRSPIFPFYSPSPTHYLFSKRSKPQQFVKRPFPPSSPDKHIKAVLARR